ncbi:hypothetical protein ACQ4PT_023763 [Festuca glaucescens]
MGRWLGSKRKGGEKDEDEKEYEVDDVVPDRSRSSRNSRLELVGRLPPIRRHSRLGTDGREEGFLHGRIIHPDNKGLPRKLFFLDIVGQIAFLVDIVLKFVVAYRDTDTYRIVYNPTSIALREIDITKRYITSLYFAIVTMATVGYGDIHAVNVREMIFLMIYVSFDMVLGAYLVGNMTAMIVKGSATERFRDRMKEVIRYMNRNKLGKDVREQIKGHLRLQYESSCTEASVLQNIPISIRAKVIRLQEEFYLPEEVILEQGSAVDQLYFVCQGALYPVEWLSLTVKFLVVVRSTFLTKSMAFLRIDKFGSTPLLEAVKQGHGRVATLLFAKGAKLNLENAGSRLCMAVSKGDSEFIQGALAYGADPNSKDYDQRNPLHVAAAEGLYMMAKLLVDAGASVFATDRRGTTPLDEARESGSKPLMRLLEQAKAAELSKFPTRGEEVRNKMHPRRCPMFPYHPWDADAKRKEGVVMWIPHTIDGLIKSARATVQDTDMINDGQKLYLVRDEDTSENT